MQQSALSQIFLPVALGIVMLGLGLSLTIADFVRVTRYPKAVVVGLFCQMVLLPIVCFGLAIAFALPPALAVGLMLLAASPGGATANLYSHLAKGDVALNITLTATNSVLSLLTLPLIVNFSLLHFFGEGKAIPLQTKKVIEVFIIVLGPVSIGMLIRAKKEELAKRLDKPVRILSALVLALVIVAMLLKERANLVDYFRQVGLAALCFNLLSMATGYLVPLAVKLPKRQAIAIGMEIGIHNGTLAIAVALTALGNSVMTIPPAIYSLIMFFTAGLFGWWVNRGRKPEEDEPPAAPVAG